MVAHPCSVPMEWSRRWVVPSSRPTMVACGVRPLLRRARKGAFTWVTLQMSCCSDYASRASRLGGKITRSRRVSGDNGYRLWPMFVWTCGRRCRWVSSSAFTTARRSGASNGPRSWKLPGRAWGRSGIRLGMPPCRDLPYPRYSVRMLSCCRLRCRQICGTVLLPRDEPESQRSARSVGGCPVEGQAVQRQQYTITDRIAGLTDRATCRSHSRLVT